MYPLARDLWYDGVAILTRQDDEIPKPQEHCMTQHGSARIRKRILVLDDMRAWRNDCQLELEQAGFLVETCESRSELEHILRKRSDDFDVVVVDLKDTGIDHETLPPLTLLYPEIAFIIYSIEDTMAAYYLDPDISNVKAYVVKQDGPATLRECVECVLTGESGICSERVIIKNRLTPRQLNVLKLVAAGLTTDAIAHRLGVKPSAVEDHRAEIIRRLNAQSMPNAVYIAIREGLIR